MNDWFLDFSKLIGFFLKPRDEINNSFTVEYMYRKSSIHHWVVALALVATSAACSSTSSTNAAVETIPTFPDNGKSQSELVSLASTLKSVDYSKISESSCGKYSLIVQKDRVRFYQWNGKTWLEQSDLLGQDYESDPFSVLSADYSDDGVLDFLVSYNKDGQQGGHQFGGIFMQVDCEWKWAKFNGSEDVSESLDLLAYDKSTQVLTAWDYGPEGRANVSITFNSESKEFDLELTAEDSSNSGSNGDESQNASDTGNQSPTCISLRDLYNEGFYTSDPYEFEAVMNDAVYILRGVGWGMIADSIVSFTLQGLRSAALGGIANYLRAYDCA